MSETILSERLLSKMVIGDVRTWGWGKKGGVQAKGVCKTRVCTRHREGGGG